MSLKEKIEKLKTKRASQRDAFNLKVKETKERAGAGELDEAKKLKKEADEIKEKMTATDQEISDLESLENLDEEPELEEELDEDEEVEDEGEGEDIPPLKKKKGDERSMKKKKKIIKTENEEVKSFEEYLRSSGKVRDGLTTENQSIIIPEDISMDIYRLKETGVDLTSMITVKKVGRQSGTMLIAKRSTDATLKTKEELAEMDNVDVDMFFNVPYKVDTRAGQIALSEETIDDAGINVVGEVKEQMRKIVKNTNNMNILKVLKTDFDKKPANSVDDVKTVKNKDLDPDLNMSFLTNQDGYNWMDLQKDEDGRYLLQDSISSKTGKMFLGVDVAVISNKLLTSDAAGFPLFLGDFKEAVGLFDRKKVEVSWTKFDSYTQGLATVVRNDYRSIDKEAMIQIQVKTTP